MVPRGLLGEGFTRLLRRTLLDIEDSTVGELWPRQMNELLCGEKNFLGNYTFKLVVVMLVNRHISLRDLTRVAVIFWSI